MDRDITEMRLFIVIVLLVVILFYSRSCSDSRLKAAEEQHQEQIESIEAKYFSLYDDLYGEYAKLYYACQYDPDSSVPLEEFTPPDELPYPAY